MKVTKVRYSEMRLFVCLFYYSVFSLPCLCLDYEMIFGVKKVYPPTGGREERRWFDVSMKFKNDNHRCFTDDTHGIGTVDTSTSFLFLSAIHLC